MKNLLVAALQLNSQDNYDNNMQSIEELTKNAASKGVQLMALPEYANYLSEFRKKEHAEGLDGKTMERYKSLAKRLKIYFHCGSFLEKSDNPERPYNTSVLINPQGDIMAYYRKIHLFDVVIPGQVDAKESNTITPGDRVVTVKTEFGTFGFTICYDLRFPELFRSLTNLGAKLIFMPAAFTLYTGKDHWETLLRARAIENQVFIVAPGQFGSHPPGKLCFGSSIIVDPWGTVIAKASEGVGHAICEIDWEIQEKVRTNLPCLKHKVDFRYSQCAL